MAEQQSLRDRKRERTRKAIVSAATELFERKGYDETTVADIAAAAEIGTRTFFSYFASKEEVLFPESDARVQAVIGALADRSPDEGPADVLLRALRQVSDPGADLVSRTAALRMRLIMSVPAVRGRGLQIQLAAQREIARHLHSAYPEELTEMAAAALAGAMIGAVVGALLVLFEQPGTELSAQRVAEATELALSPWSRRGSST